MSPRRQDNPPLDREHVAADPIEQFGAWFADAERVAPLPEAMTIATVDAEGAPNARMVLLKGFGPDGFRFFTNYDRQVRIRGAVERLPAADSDAYFASRPRDSQIAASISPQSRPIERDELERRFGDRTAELGDGEVSRPGHWGGYLLRPEVIEFWQGRDNRMHDRLVYTRQPGGWEIQRLAP